MQNDQWLEAVERRIGVQAADRRPTVPRSLTVLFDPECALCRRCERWMRGQPQYVELEFLSSKSEIAEARFGDLPWLGEELVVVGDAGEVWIGPAAFLTCLWALVRYREWAYRLSSDSLAPLAERFFLLVSHHRRSFGQLLRPHDCADGHCRFGRSRAALRDD